MNRYSTGPRRIHWMRLMPPVQARRSLTRAMAIAALVACGGPDGGPVSPAGAPNANTATVTDPVGDTFGFAGPLWDLTALSVTRDATGITVILDVSADVISPMAGGDSALIAFVDLDLDQDATTGFEPVADAHRPDGLSSGTGSDARVNLSVFGTDSMVDVVGPRGLAGRVKPVFQGHQVTIRVPKAVLGNDDGLLNAIALVGNSTTPTDIIPERGHLTIGPSMPMMSPRRTIRPCALPDDAWPTSPLSEARRASPAAAPTGCS
jgi:hypothetical protein